MELSTALKFTFPDNVCSADRIRQLLPSAETTTRIIITDRLAPKGVRKYDVSEAQDGGVVRWKVGDTYYVSTQRAGVKVIAPEHCFRLFSELESLKTFDGTMLDVSGVTEMRCMFYGCTSLLGIIGLQGWDIRNVKDIRLMFAYCPHLEIVDGLADWDVSHVEKMNDMFLRCPKMRPRPKWYHNDVD
jgi:hypothetical protein